MALTSPDEQALREAIVAEAYSWLGTPYGECGMVKGPAGCVDCAMILVAIFRGKGRFPADYDPRPYSPEWHLHHNEERYLAGFEQYGRRVESAQIADVALYRFGRTASHSGIIVSDDLIIHAHKRGGNVELCERRALESRLDSYYTVF